MSKKVTEIDYRYVWSNPQHAYFEDRDVSNELHPPIIPFIFTIDLYPIPFS